MNKKKIILLVLALLILIAVLSWVFVRINKGANNNQAPAQSFKVEYMTAAEKAAKNLDPNTRAQVIQRDSGNNVIVYKLIRKDSDVVTDLRQLEVQRPPRPEIKQ
ncbi:MAG: hypothetical protein WC441_03615 [Patescibacteria group bacterium]